MFSRFCSATRFDHVNLPCADSSADEYAQQVLNGDPLRIESWSGSLDGIGRGHAATELFAVLGGGKGGTGAFPALSKDGNTYWLKVPSNPQGLQSVVHEVVVA